MGRLKSALLALCLAVPMVALTAQQRPGPTDNSVAQAVALVVVMPSPTFVAYLPLLHGNCTSDCPSTATPTATATSTAFHTPPASPSATASPTDAPAPSPSATPTRQVAVVTLPVVADTFIVEGTTGQADANFGDFPGMFVGYDDQGWRRERALMQFDLDALPKDAVVRRATLEMYIHNCFTCKPMDVDALRVTGPWRESEATWNTSPTLPGEAYARGVIIAPGAWVFIDLTRLVADWREGAPNYGVMLVGREALPHDWWSIEAREDGAVTAPRLVVTYVSG